MRSVQGVIPLVLGIMVVACPVAMAGKNAGGAMVVHTDDSHSWTNGVCDRFDDWVPQSCDSLNTRTDNDENTPALTWFIAAFPDTADPGVSVAYFGIDHNLPQWYIERHGYCGPGGTIEVPDTGWPDDTDAGNSVAFGSAVTSDSLFPFYYFSSYGFSGAYLGTAANPTGGYAAFVDDSNPPVQDEVTSFGTVRWYAAGSNDCPSGAMDGGGEGGEQGGEEDEADQDPGGEEGEGQWLDGDGERHWMADCILVRLREDLPMPPREPVDGLGIPAFDGLCQELDLGSVQRILTLGDESCSRFPIGSHVVKLRFGPGTDELATVDRFAQLPEVVWAQPDYVSSMEFFSSPVYEPSEHQDGGEDAFDQQWHLKWLEGAKSCLDLNWDLECCPDCDIGVDTAWQYTRGNPSVSVAFIDDGADMQHPDLFDVWARNPDPRENIWDSSVRLCDDADSLGDIDYTDADSNGVADDVLLGYSVSWPSWEPYWKHLATPHGTAVAGILGAITNNNLGVASVAGGNDSLSIPGVRLIQFSVAGDFHGVPQSALFNTFY